MCLRVLQKERHNPELPGIIIIKKFARPSGKDSLFLDRNFAILKIKGGWLVKRNQKGVIISMIFIAVAISGLYQHKPVSLKDISTVEGFVTYARSFGPVMPLFTFIVTIIQAVVPVIPFVILCSANGLLFGLTKGIIITMIGTLAGASITFFVSRQLGYKWAVKRYEQSRLRNIARMNGPRGFFVILTLRLLPYFPAPVINVSAGVSQISFWSFLAASALGKLPFVLGYTLLGYSLLHGKNYILGAVIVLSIIVVPYLVVKMKKRSSALLEKD